MKEQCEAAAPASLSQTLRCPQTLLTSIVIQPSSADSVRANRALFVLRIFRVRTRLCAYISLIIFLPRHTPSYMPSPVTAFVAAMCHLIV